MKTILITSVLFLLMPQNNNKIHNIREIVIKKQSLSKSKLKSLGVKGLCNFNDKFTSDGSYVECHNLIACTFNGLRNDTLFDLELVFDKEELVSSFLLPESVMNSNKGQKKIIAIGEIVAKKAHDNKCITISKVKFDAIEYSKAGGKWFYQLGKNKTYEEHLICSKHD
jgi:hypothetical protein